ncbi:MAG: ABC transporter substrate-binding protein, partial [Microcoleus sp.]
MQKHQQASNQPMNFSQKSGKSATLSKTKTTQNPGAAGLQKLLFAAGIASLCASCQNPQAPNATIPGGTPAASPVAVSAPGDPNTVKIVSMLPMTGSALGQSQTMVNGIKQALAETDSKACDGKIKIEYEVLDDATAAAGKWDPAQVTSNSNKIVADGSVVAAIGHYNSGAAKLSIPVLNQANVVMISPANTYPGL